MITKILNAKGVPFQINCFGSMMSIHFTDETAIAFTTSAKGNNDTFETYFLGMLDKGIYLPPSAFECYFLNDALTYANLDETIAALDGVEL